MNDGFCVKWDDLLNLLFVDYSNLSIFYMLVGHAFVIFDIHDRLHLGDREESLHNMHISRKLAMHE